MLVCFLFCCFLLGGGSEAKAAITAGGATCTAQSATPGTSLACTVATENIDVGNVAVLLFGGDNTSASNDNSQLVTSVTDSGSNTWVVQRCYTNARSGANTGATTCIATSKITTALASGVGTITANFGATDAKAITVREFVVGAGNGLQITGTPQEVADVGSDPSLLSITGLPTNEYVFIRSVALERNAVTWTPTTNYTTMGCNTTSGGGSAGNNGVCGEYLIISATTSSASDPTATGVDNASIYVAMKEASTTISGTLYVDEGSTVFGTSKTIKVVSEDLGSLYENAIATTTTTNASGVYSITLPVGMATTTPILVFVDGDTTARAAFFTKASSTLNTSFPGSDLYLNRFVISHSSTSGTSTLIADLAFYDSDNDADVQFNASSTARTLTVFANQKLFIAPNKTFAPDGEVTVSGMASSTSQTDGSIHIANGATFTQNGTTTLAGSFTASSTSVFTPSNSVSFTFNATTTGKIILLSGSNTLGSTTFNGSGGGWTFATSATTSNISIVNGTVAAPAGNLTIVGNFANSGTFSNNNGTTTFVAKNTSVDGTFVGSSAFNNIKVNQSTFQVATSSSEDFMFSSVIDYANSVLYVGSGSSIGGGILYRCALSTGCDSSADFSIATDTGDSNIYALTIDTDSNILYIGTGDTGWVFRCALSTGCDSSADFTVSGFMNVAIHELIVDQVNDVMFAGTGSNGIIYRCPLSSLCDAVGDWSTATNTGGSAIILSLAIDTTNGVLYAGGSSQKIFRCVLSTGCTTTDFTLATVTSESIRSMVFDSQDSILYVGGGTSGRIIRCDTSTSCDGGTDYTVATDTAASAIFDITIDLVNGYLYFGSGLGSSYIHRCALSSGCDDGGDFSIFYLTHASTIGVYTLIVDSNNGSVFAGTGNNVGASYIYKYAQGLTFNSNASTTNILIERENKVITPPHLSVSGAYNNSGTLISDSTDTFLLNGSSAQSATGTMTGTSAFGNLVVTGNSTKTFGANASTTGDVRVDSGATLVAPAGEFSIGGNFTQNGTYTTNGNGTTTFTGNNITISGSLIGSSSLSNITFSKNNDDFNFIGVTTTSQNAIHGQMIVDETGGALYVALYGGIMVKCTLSTKCDESNDFRVVATISGATFLEEMKLDETNRALYVLYDEVLKRCALSTGCDATGEYTTLMNKGSYTLDSIALDISNNVMYVGYNGYSTIYKCTLTSCASYTTLTFENSGTEWSNRLEIDTVNGALFVGAGNKGNIYRCLISTGCSTSANYNVATTVGDDRIEHFIIDSASSTLYMRSVIDGHLYRCALSTGCDAGGEFTFATRTNGDCYSPCNSIINHGSGRALYLPINDDDYVYCLLSTGCDQQSDFSVVESNSGGQIDYDDTNHVFYGFGGETGFEITRFEEGSVILRNSASTSNLSIGQGTKLYASSTFSISGNYTNSGTTTWGATTTFNGTTEQVATGTMTGTSAFGNLVIENTSATTTFGASLTVSGNFIASSTSQIKLAFVSNGTTTFTNAQIIGTSGNEIRLRSTTDGTEHKLVITGAYTVNYADIKDSNACGSTGGGLTATTSIEGTGNTCWTFAGAGEEGGGGGNPAVLFLSGTLYSDEGVTPLARLATVALAVGTGTPSVQATTTTASGAFTFGLDASHTMGTSTPILIWLDATSTKAALFTKAPSSTSISNLNLYENRVIVSHEATSGTSTTITNMSFYDSDNDGDIPFTAATTTNTLTVFAGNKLYIKENKTFAPGGHVVVRGNASSTSNDGTLHLASSSIYTAGGNTTLAGNFIASSTGFVPNGYTLNFNASTTGKYIYATSSLGNVYISGSSTSYSFRHTNATTTNLFINTNATVTAPSGILTVEGDLVNGGGFLNNNGTVRMATTSLQYVSGNFATSSAFNNINIVTSLVEMGDAMYSVATNTSSTIRPSIIDVQNYVLYVASNEDVGGLTRCALVTGCNDGNDFVLATNTPSITSMVIDTSNGVLYYAGGYSVLEGIIYRCVLSTGCDSAGDFTVATTTVQTVYSLAIDPDGTLYAGSGSSGKIYRCVLSTGCDNGADFTTVSSVAALYSLVVDTQNDVLYGGSGDDDGIIYRCVLSTGCDSAGDFTVATTTAGVNITFLGMDSINGVLYAGDWYNEIFFRCALSTGCDSAGDFTVFATGYNTFAVQGDYLYVTKNNTIYYCLLSKGCNSESDLSLGSPIPSSQYGLGNLVSNSINDTLYILSDISVYRCSLCYVASESITNTQNFTIESGATLVNNTETRISGNYTNNGTSTFTATSTTVFMGSSAQSISGTLTASSTFGSLTFIGAGTKTFNNNASSTGTFVVGAESTVIAPSSLTVGVFDNAGSFTAPSEVLMLTRSATNTGSFSHNNGTVHLVAFGGKIQGRFTGTSAFNNFVATKTAMVYEVTTESTLPLGVLALDTQSNTLYSWTGAAFYSCSLTSDPGCNQSTSIYATSTMFDTVFIDNANGALYLGGNGSGEIYKCVLSTGCDASADYVKGTTTAASGVGGVVMDTASSTLYFGSFISGHIHRCALTTGCDSATDFTVATKTRGDFDTTDSLDIDTVNNVLYIGVTGDGDAAYILRCVISTGCDTSTDFVVATVTIPSSYMRFVHIDQASRILYAGIDTLNELFLLRCDIAATNCDSSTDFVFIGTFPAPDSGIASFQQDRSSGILYLMTSPSVYRCMATLTGCDSGSDFVISNDSFSPGLYNQVNRTMYGSGATLLYRPSGTIFVGAASTSNMQIDARREVQAVSSPLTISGNYTNNGIFIASTTATTTFNGTSPQVLQGNMTATSTFGNLAFRGAGTKTFNNNASTSGNFYIYSGSGAVVAPPQLSIAGSYNNDGTFTAGSGTTTFSGTSAQLATGTLSGTSAFNTLVLQGTSTKTLGATASTTNLLVEAGATLIAPTIFSVSGNYQNYGTTTYTGTTTFNGTSIQSATGTMIGSSAFNTLEITNTSGGSSSPSILFGAAASTTGTLFMRASSSAAFAAGATSTFQNIYLEGSVDAPVYLRSTSPGTQYSFYVPGNQYLLSYVDVRDSNACPVTIDASAGNNTDSGNNTCWTFSTPGGSVTISSNANQTFAYSQATTGISQITIAEGVTPNITAANDLRIKIATTSVNMRFDTTDVTATFGGTASGKVSNPVYYEAEGSTLVIPVDTNFSASDTLTISDLSFSQFLGANAATSALAVRVAGPGTTTSTTDDKTITIHGLLEALEHTAGQVSDNFDFPSASDVELFSFKLTPTAESSNISSVVFRLQGLSGIGDGDLSNARLYRDLNDNLVYDEGDTQIGGTGSIALGTGIGSITFSTAFQATTTQNYLLIADLTDITTTNAMRVVLAADDITTTGSTSLITITPTGSVSGVQHLKGTGGAGGSASAVGGNAPAGDGVRSGGGQGGGGADPNSGDTIGNEVGFNAPTTNGTPNNAWTNGGNAYSSDGSYATAATIALQQSYGSFDFSVPSNNTIAGIEVKLEASASTNAGNILVYLSWDGGSTFTDFKTSNTLTTSDAVYTLGGPSDTWGRSWTPAETGNGNLVVNVLSSNSINTIRIDALQVKVYHQASGGSQGGGGAVFKKPNTHYASVYEAITPNLKLVLESIVEWLKEEKRE